jgi:hypothetical protein
VTESKTTGSDANMQTRLLNVYAKVHTELFADLNKLDETGISGLADVKAPQNHEETIGLADALYKSLPSTDASLDTFTETVLAPGISVKTVLPLIQQGDTKHTFMLYLYILSTLAAALHSDDPSLQTVAGEALLLIELQRARKAEDKGDDTDILPKSVCKWLDCIRNLELEQAAVAEEEEESANAAGPGGLPDISFLKNTKIGSLAEEISREIDISALNIEKPEDLLNLGNTANGSIIGDIVSKVGSKIQNKLSSGEINQEELLGEAMSLIGKFGGAGAGGGAGGLGNLGNLGNLSEMMNNPLFKTMMSAMGNNVPKGARAAMNTGKVRQLSARERLRSKLAKKNNSAPKEE